jgi:hypothetical protein
MLGIFAAHFSLFSFATGIAPDLLLVMLGLGLASSLLASSIAFLRTAGKSGKLP